jgi:hypothetical protein
MEVKPEPRRSFSLRMRRASHSSKAVNQMGNESFSRAGEEEMDIVVTKSPKREPRMSFTMGLLLRAGSTKAIVQNSSETSSDGPETENREPKPEPRRSFSLRLRRSSSTASMPKKSDEGAASDDKRDSKKKKKKDKKSFPRIGGLVRRLSARKKRKSVVSEQAPATFVTTDVNASFDTEETSEPSEKSLHRVDLNFLGNEDFDIESEEADELDASFLILAPEEKALDVIVLVIDPNTRHFEIVLLEFFLHDFHVSDLLARIPASVVQEELRQLKFEGVCDLKNRIFSDDTLMTDVCPNGRDILVAIPKGVAADVCSKQARIVLNDKEVLQLVRGCGRVYRRVYSKRVDIPTRLLLVSLTAACLFVCLFLRLFILSRNRLSSRQLVLTRLHGFQKLQAKIRSHSRRQVKPKLQLLKRFPSFKSRRHLLKMSLLP